MMTEPAVAGGQPFKLNFLWAGLCMIGAIYFVFRTRYAPRLVHWSAGSFAENRMHRTIANRLARTLRDFLALLMPTRLMMNALQTAVGYES
jgi:hypothetical protein